MSDENTTQVVEVVPSGAPVLGPFSAIEQGFINEIYEIGAEGALVHAALWAAKTHLPAIAKDGQLTFGQNTVAFTKVEDIRKALYPQFAKFGIMAYYRIVGSDETLQVAHEPWTQAQAIDPETGKVDRSGVIGDTGRAIYDGRIPKTRMWAWVEYEVDFVCILDGSKVTVGPFKGSAYDTDSDKATGKATTAAIKRLLSETFDVVDEKESELDETGEDTKNRPETTDRRQASEGTKRGDQALAAAAPGATSRPGRPARGRKAAEPAPEAPKVEAPAAEPAKPEPTPAAEPVAPAPSKAEDHPTTDLKQPTEQDVAAADTATGEVKEEKVVEPETPPAPPTAPMPDKLAAAKERVKAANLKLMLSKSEVDAIATEVSGIALREEWITKGTAVAKLADALEAKIAERGL